MVTLEKAVATTPVRIATSLLGGFDAAALGLDVSGPLKLAAGICCYRVRASDYRSGAPLEEIAWRWGWRFYLTSGETLLPAAVDVQPGRDAGTWAAGFAVGGGLGIEIDVLASARTTEAEGQVRLLHVPSLSWGGLWILGPKQQLITATGDRISSVASLARHLRRARMADKSHRGGSIT